MGCCVLGCRILGCRSPFGRGSEAAFRSELRSLWQTDFATPSLGAVNRAAEVCSAEATQLPSEASFALCGKQTLPPPSLGCRVLGCRSLFGRGSEAACLGETCGLCGKRTLPPHSPRAREEAKSIYSVGLP